MKRPSQELDILAAFLDEPARQALEADAGNDQTRARTIAESHRLKDALERGAAIERRELDELVLAFAILGDDPLAHTWRSRIRDRVGEDAAAAAKIETVRRRSDSLEAGSDAAAHFARLTGHTAAPGPSRRGLWLAAASVAFLVLAHGVYQGVTEDPVRHAAWSQLERPRPTRSGTPAASALQRANEIALASRTSILGMWPRYDLARLLEADALLADRDDPPAVLLRAQIQAAAGQYERSRRTLESVAPSPTPANWQALKQILAPEAGR